MCFTWQLVCIEKYLSLEASYFPLPLEILKMGAVPSHKVVITSTSRCIIGENHKSHANCILASSLQIHGCFRIDCNGTEILAKPVQMTKQRR